MEGTIDVAFPVHTSGGRGVELPKDQFMPACVGQRDKIAARWQKVQLPEGGAGRFVFLDVTVCPADCAMATEKLKLSRNIQLHLREYGQDPPFAEDQIRQLATTLRVKDHVGRGTLPGLVRLTTPTH